MATSTPNPAIVPRRRPVLTALGALLVAVSAVAAAAAIAVLSAFGPDSTLDSGPHPVSTSTAAVVAHLAMVEGTHGIGSLTGWPTVRVSADGTGPGGIFVGIAPAAAVDEYLLGVAVDQVTEPTAHPFALPAERRPGAATAPSPTEQSFWLASATSPALADLTWQVRNGDHRVVLMRPDGTASLTTTARIRVTLPHAFPISLGVLGACVLVATGGVVLMISGPRTVTAGAA